MFPTSFYPVSIPQFGSAITLEGVDPKIITRAEQYFNGSKTNRIIGLGHGLVLRVNPTQDYGLENLSAQKPARCTITPLQAESLLILLAAQGTPLTVGQISTIMRRVRPGLTPNGTDLTALSTKIKTFAGPNILIKEGRAPDATFQLVFDDPTQVKSTD